MLKIASKIAIILLLVEFFSNPFLVLAQSNFDPHFIISDQELQDTGNWTRYDVQKFLDNKGSYLRMLQTEDANGVIKSAADIIYDTSNNYKINPKYVLVTLQKEQSLITDDSPTQKQLDWAAGYGVCDSCGMDDPKIQKFKGFGKQIDNAVGAMRYYYEHTDASFVKKKDIPIQIDNQNIIPGSWATAFLYTYTPHINGNKNFWRIWQTWFEQIYPNGTLLSSLSNNDMWLLQNGIRRKFKNKTALITRMDPKLAIKISEVELQNYKIGPEIDFPNFSLLRAASTTYLVDNYTLRPFISNDVVAKFGYNPQEIIDVDTKDLVGFSEGLPITASTTAPAGIVYEITDLKNALYLYKDGVLNPITDKLVVKNNFPNLQLEKHKLKDIKNIEVANIPIMYKDGTLIQTADSSAIYVIDNGKRRRIADEETFKALGYKHANVITVNPITLANFPSGDRLFFNSYLQSSKNKFLGDSAAPTVDLYGEEKLPTYLVAEYPSGRIISGKNIDSQRPIASLTKLVVAFEALEQDCNLNGITTYNNEKHAAGTNTMQLVNGEKIRNRDLLYATLVASNNTAARMIAQSTKFSETEMLKKINTRLEDWGADNTIIDDTTGLSEGNKSTARDLLKIFIKVLENKSIKVIAGETTYTFKEVLNKNKLLTHNFKHSNQLIKLKNRNYQIIASKTGYTEEAGSLLAMLIRSKKTKKQYVVLTMGNENYKDRFREPNNIATWISAGTINIAKNN